jgi:cell fate (sporulation/competence/biofilm development) regulator YlbF (YheA/YmcA/DUF963 family)
LSLEQKAIELAQLLKETDEFKALSSAQTRIRLDPIAEDLIKQLQLSQQEIYMLQMEGKEPTMEQIQQIQLLEAKVKSNLTITNFVKAQEAFSRKMSELNETITRELFN